MANAPSRQAADVAAAQLAADAHCETPERPEIGPRHRCLFQDRLVNPQARDNDIAFIAEERWKKRAERLGNDCASGFQFRTGRKGEINRDSGRLAFWRFITERWKIPVGEKADVALNIAGGRFCHTVDMPEQRKRGRCRILSKGNTRRNQSRSE